MKLKFFIALLFAGFSSYGQDITFVSDFELLEVQNGIFVNWEIDSGYTCQGVDILRSDDGVDFYEVGHISGVCGSLSKSVAYSFLDDSPSPGITNHYRLKLNGKGYTEILSLFYQSVPDQGVLVFPNPSLDRNVTVKYANPNQEKMQIEIYDINGHLVFRQISATNEVRINLGAYQSGAYIVRVSSQEESRTLDFSTLILN
ncbi:T9SS type A sorting domain-containing protein [Parvicella tangerina]|nr:T9SS type A sorting domain-containing protein [Parvicella tangerina]